MAKMTTTAAPTANLARAEALPRRLLWRRILVAGLNIGTVVGLAAWMAALFASGGIAPLEVAMWLAFLVTLPWLAIGFWNAVIGTLVTARSSRPTDPLALDDAPDSPIRTRTALLMTLRNENAAEAIRRVRLMFEDIAATGEARHFDVHVLSDTDDPAIAADEEAEVERWRRHSDWPGHIHYRRRTENTGYKAGNIADFCDANAGRYDFFLTLDADSFVAGAVILRLVRTMQAEPKLGILQTLAVGTPSTSAFTRAFQFGMRHGMRAHTAGAVWWSGDCGPYWGHNALIRMAPFHAHCHLPVLPGDGPLGGHIMSHDQVEAVLMRKAGYHVRVVATESESFEENPPTLPDFVRRELRWCQGNFQYLSLLSMPGLLPLSRVQLALAILMFLGAPAWMAFIVFGTIGAATYGGGLPMGWGLALVSVMLFLCFAPKLMGLMSVLASGRQARRYGGRARVAAGGLFEFVTGLLTAPVVAFATAVFAFGLLWGKRIDWRAQPRAARSVTWREAITGFLPQTVFGLVVLVVLALSAPVILPLAAPVIAGLVLAAPFAVWSANPALGRIVTQAGICAIPEELATPPSLSRLQQGTPSASAANAPAGGAPAYEPATAEPRAA